MQRTGCLKILVSGQNNSTLNLIFSLYMLLMGYHNYFFLLCVIFSLCNNAIIQATPTPPSNRTAYYFSVEGNDANDGSITHPLKTISFLNALTLKPGDSILLKG